MGERDSDLYDGVCGRPALEAQIAGVQEALPGFILEVCSQRKEYQGRDRDVHILCLRFISSKLLSTKVVMYSLKERIISTSIVQYFENVSVTLIEVYFYFVNS